jgi:hypothetical protein
MKYLGLVLLFAFSAANAQTLKDLQRDVDTLQKQVAKLQDQNATQNKVLTQISSVVNSQTQLITALQQQNATLQAVLGCMSKAGTEVYFTGCNVHIVSGAGATEAPVNGLGNLIVGYNEDGDGAKTGSHNLVVGPGHSYTSFGGLVAGRRNSVLGEYSSVTGGDGNQATGRMASVSGGNGNRAWGGASSIVGGAINTASGENSTISGGYGNVADGPGSSVGGGLNRIAASRFNWTAGSLFEAE